MLYKLDTWQRMCIQLAFLGPGTCFSTTPHFSNSRKTKLVSPGENLSKQVFQKSTTLHRCVLSLFQRQVPRKGKPSLIGIIFIVIDKMNAPVNSDPFFLVEIPSWKTTPLHLGPCYFPRLRNSNQSSWLYNTLNR